MSRNARPPRPRDAGHVSVDAYPRDPMYPSVVRAVAALLAEGKVVAPVAVLVRMGKLRPADLDAWRRGRVPYLERVIHGNLTQLRRWLRILRYHAHDLSLKPSFTAYVHRGKHAKVVLRFSKTGDRRLEEAYATHFVWPGKGPFPMERALGKLEPRSEPVRSADATRREPRPAPVVPPVSRPKALTAAVPPPPGVSVTLARGTRASVRPFLRAR